jgi:hypothetical protein
MCQVETETAVLCPMCGEPVTEQQAFEFKGCCSEECCVNHAILTEIDF